MKTHLMIDIETLATSADAVVTQIGAAWFDFEKFLVGEMFTVDINVGVQSLSRSVDVKTMLWYAEQGIVPVVSGVPLNTALRDLAQFYQKGVAELGGDAEVEVWCNGASFDFSILNNAFDGGLPWGHWQERDVRTEIAAAKRRGVFVEKGKNTHKAIGDVLNQISWLKQCYDVQWPQLSVREVVDVAYEAAVETHRQQGGMDQPLWNDADSRVKEIFHSATLAVVKKLGTHQVQFEGGESNG